MVSNWLKDIRFNKCGNSIVIVPSRFNSVLNQRQNHASSERVLIRYLRRLNQLVAIFAKSLLKNLHE